MQTLARSRVLENRVPLLPCAAEEKLLVAIGKAIATLHDAGLIHGDLTTSNMLVRKDTGELVGN